MKNDNEKTSFLDGYHAKSPDELGIIRRWINARPQGLLSVPVGIGRDNNLPFSFELRSNSRLGAVVGPTGSGKTEFLKTWLLSLAVNYPPSDVQFFVIDRGYPEYSEIARLPHCAGHVVVDTEFGSVGYRITAALENELHRRKEIANDNHGNVAQQKLPELIIVVDCEDLFRLRYTEERLFQVLIEAARCGHALGMKLFFSVQDPERIWRESSLFGIQLDYSCVFRMFRFEESRRLIGSDDAVGLSQGSMICKSGSSCSKVRAFFSSCRLAETDGQKSKVTESTAIINYICQLCENNGIEYAKKIILPPLPDFIPLESYLHGTSATESTDCKGTPIGVIDNTHSCSRDVLYIDPLSSEHTLILGDTGSGKTTLLYTLLVSICNTTAPKDVRVFFWGRDQKAIRIIGEYPHVQQAVFVSDRDELRSSLESLNENLKESLQNQQGVLPHLVLLIDDVDALLRESTDFRDVLSRIVSNRQTHVHLIATTNPGSTFPRQFYFVSNMKTPFCLRLPSPVDYRGTVGNPDHELFPIPGRGFVKADHPMEFQLFSLLSSGKDTEYNALQDYSNALKKKWSIDKAEGKRRPIYQLPGYAIDVVFCVDASASMFYTLQLMKRHIGNFADELKSRYSARSQSIESIRIRFVFFRDYLTDGSDAMLVSDFINLSQETVDLNKMLEGIDAFGGVNVPRSGLEALAIAMHSPWSTGAFRTRNYIVLISDSEARELYSCQTVSNYPKRMPDSFEKLSEMWSTISDEWENVIHFPSGKVGCRDFCFEEIVEILAGLYTF